MKKQRYFYVMFILMAFLMLSCSASKQLAPYNPNFKWSPDQKKTASSAKVTFALVRPMYSENQIWSLQSFPDFSLHLGNSFQELLISKGFDLKGPYNSLNDLTFQDKKMSDLAIYPALGIYIRFLDNEWGYDLGGNLLTGLLNKNAAKKYNLSGHIVIGGQVNIVAIEPLSGQKMWVKNINLIDSVFQVKGELVYEGIGQDAPGNLQGMEVPINYFNDNGIKVPIAKALENYFVKLLNTTQSYLDPEEMQSIKKQVEEIRSKKVY